MCFSAKARMCTNPKNPRSAAAPRCVGSERHPPAQHQQAVKNSHLQELSPPAASALVVTVRTSIGDRRKWSKDIVSSYTILRRRPPHVCFKPLITNGIELNARVVTGVCDNQFAAARKLLILKTRRDGRVVDGARLESEAGQRHQPALKRLKTHAISDLTPPHYLAMCVRKPRCSSRFRA